MAVPESVFNFETELSRELVCWLDALLPDFSHRPKIRAHDGRDDRFWRRRFVLGKGSLFTHAGQGRG